MFNDRQEQDLGDALAEYFESAMRIAPPPADDRLTRIGERLLATLPPSGLQYRFRIYESGEVNGFSLAGGRVYISRKLIAAVKSEDELAGVVAHEIGHLSTHQTAIEITRILRIRLGVEAVTDRADIFAKVHRMMNTAEKPQEEENREDKDELVADHVALYAMERAGYAAESFPAFFNQVSMNKGKTGNWLSDFFGVTHQSSQRYRAALKLIDALPAGCKGGQPDAGDAFQAWQRGVVEERVKTVAVGVSGDQPLKLDSPLRPSLWRIRFSPNGLYLLAQDEGSVTVVDRKAGKVLFRIEAPDVEAAQFTPDSASVVFSDSKLRVERWSVATGQRTQVKEMVVYDGCNQSLLSPDGRTLVCTSVSLKDGLTRVGLRLLDVESGKPVYDKPAFFEDSAFTPVSDMVYWALREMAGAGLATLKTSPDGKYLLVVVRQHALAYDLKNRQQVALGGKLKDLEQREMSFLGPDQLLVVGAAKGKDLYEARILTFPDGQVVKDTLIGDQQIESVTQGRALIARPLKNYAAGILDPSQGKFLAAAKLPAMDAWDQSVATENVSGGIAVGQIGGGEVMRIPLSLGSLPNPRAAVFSPDGKFLAVSVKSRGEIWDLETGKQIGLFRPFRSAWIDDEDRLFLQFPKFLDKDPAEVRFALPSLETKEFGKYDDDDWQYHDLQYRLKPLGKDKAISRRATLEVKKMESQATAWTRDYQHETPAIWPAEDGRLVLAWDLSNDTAKAEIKSLPALQRQMDALGDNKKGILIETVVPETGAPLEQVIIPETDLTQGRNDMRRAVVSGEFVLAHGEHDNTVIYRLDGGAKVGEFFGSPVATDAATGLIAAVNREDEILLVDERSGRELKRFTLGSPVRTARIATGQKKVLLVLTADQVIHRLPLPE